MAFQFPPSPAVNQTFTPVAGVTYRWSGTAWHLIAGPGAFITQAEGDARYRLLTNMTFTGPVLHADGTVAAPGISWANEPTMGFYRSVAGRVNFAGNLTVNAVLKATGNGVVSGAANAHEFGCQTDFIYAAEFFHRVGGEPRGIAVQYPNYGGSVQGQDMINCSHGGGGRFAVWTNGGIWNFSANNVNASDASIKQNIVPAPDYTAFVEQLQFKQFNYASQTDVVDGVIAQEIEAQDPALVTKVDGKLGVYDHRLQQRINSVIPKLIERIKVLEEKLTALESS